MEDHFANLTQENMTNQLSYSEVVMIRKQIHHLGSHKWTHSTSFLGSQQEHLMSTSV